MCGIFAYLAGDTTLDLETLRKYAMACKHRGPDGTKEINKLDTEGIYFMFHRLSINGLSEAAMQPFVDDDAGYMAMCNGEIYNYKEIAENYNIRCLRTGSDCEIIIPLLIDTRDIKECCNNFDGVYAITVWHQGSKTLLVARDPFGVRSLYYGYSPGEEEGYIVASELKCFPDNFVVRQVPPGHYMYISKGAGIRSMPHVDSTSFSIASTAGDNSSPGRHAIEYILNKSIQKRLMSDRPIGCLLSGGLDSSIVAAVMAKNVSNLHTFSVGLEGAPDLKYARIVADHIGSIHKELILTEQEMLDAIPETIRQIESYDVTTVRASVPMYLLSKWIKENTDIRVIFSGEGSDEIFGSYLYFRRAPTPDDFQEETGRLLDNLYYFDVLRADKTTAAHGIEIRVPFLDKSFVRHCLNIPAEFKLHTNKIEKKILRDTFKDYLPESIINRRKEAFSDGVSKRERSWFTIIQEHVGDEIPYYKKIFNQHYPNREYLIPYQWLPRWCEEDSDDDLDPSARSLKIYSD